MKMFRNYIFTCLKLIISGVLIWLALKGVDLESAFERASNVDPLMLISAILLLLGQSLIGGFRWRSIGQAIDCPLGIVKAIRIFYIGTFFNQVLPGGTGGDAVRIYLFFKGGATLRGSINSVMLERLVVLAALILIVALTQSFYLPKLNNNFSQWISWFPIGMCVFLSFIIIFIMLFDQLPDTFSRWRFFRGLGYMAKDTRKLFLNYKNILPSALWGFFTHINLSLSVFCLAVGLGVNIDFFTCLVLMPPVFLITTIPLSIGGWGVRENAMIIALGLVGVSSESSLALSILFGLAILIISMPGGLVWLLSNEREKGIKISEAQKELILKNP